MLSGSTPLSLLPIALLLLQLSETSYSYNAGIKTTWGLSLRHLGRLDLSVGNSKYVCLLAMSHALLRVTTMTANAPIATCQGIGLTRCSFSHYLLNNWSRSLHHFCSHDASLGGSRPKIPYPRDVLLLCCLEHIFWSSAKRRDNFSTRLIAILVGTRRS